MEKKLYRVLGLFITSILLLAFFFPAERKVYDLDECDFSAQTSTTLYFKNTRAFYYSLEELPNAGLNVYRFSKTAKLDTGIFLNFILVHNWRADEVYIVTEPSAELLALGAVDIQVGDTVIGFDKSVMNNKDQYTFGSNVFLALLQEKPINFVSTSNSIFGNTENQDANSSVLQDYFTWIYKYR